MQCSAHAEIFSYRNGRECIYIKGVTERFGFDDRRTSQTLRIVKNKATGTPCGMFIMYSPWCILTKDAEGELYIGISVGLSALLVSTIRAMRRPFYRGTSDRTGSTFFVYIEEPFLLFCLGVWWANFTIMDVLNEIRRTVDYFESAIREHEFSVNKDAEKVWNYFAVNPDTLINNEHPYITGIFYSYFEVLLREDKNFDVVAFTNALFSFAKAMKDCTWGTERKCAAMRMFLLVCDNSRSMMQQIIQDFFRMNCYELSSYDYYNLMNNVHSSSQAIISHYHQQTFHGIVSYCYSFFASETDYNSLKADSMERLKYYINALNSTSNPLTKQSMDLSNDEYFKLFYQYLAREIEWRKNTPALCIEYKEKLDSFRLYYENN